MCFIALPQLWCRRPCTLAAHAYLMGSSQGPRPTGLGVRKRSPRSQNTDNFTPRAAANPKAGPRLGESRRLGVAANSEASCNRSLLGLLLRLRSEEPP